MGKKIHRRRKLSANKSILLPNIEMNTPTQVEMMQYDEKGYVAKILVSHTDLQNEIVKDKISWFKVTGISDIDYVSKICKNFGLHGFDIKELLTDSQVVKIVLYEEVTFALISGFYMNDEGELEDMQIAFIVGDNYVISFKESPVTVFKDIEKMIVENNVTLRQKGADFLFYALLTAVNTLNNNLILKLEDQLFAVEDELIMQRETINILHFLHDQRIYHMQMKRFLLSFREEFDNLQENENGKIKDENMIYFDNLDDKLRTTINNLDNFQESLMSLLDLYYNNNNMKLNEVMKRLTLVSTIFIPLTFLVGVWGMNFKVMPELDWQYGYLIAWLLFVVVVIIMSLLMKKKKWF